MDTGLADKKITEDTYGRFGSHDDGIIFGKDPTGLTKLEGR